MSEQEKTTNGQQEVSGPIDSSIKTSWEDVKQSAPKSEEAKPEKAKPEQEPIKEPVKEESEVDFEKELAKYKEKALREKELRKYEREERKRLQRELDERDDGSEEASAPDVQSLVKSEIEALRRSEREDVLEDVLDSLSENPHERELVRHIYEQELKPSGFSRKAIKDDLSKAFLIANRERLESVAFRNAKAKIRASEAQEKALKNAASTGGSVGREPPESTPQYTNEEMKWLQRVGKTKVDGD